MSTSSIAVWGKLLRHGDVIDLVGDDWFLDLTGGKPGEDLENNGKNRQHFEFNPEGPQLFNFSELTLNEH
jgi:hypothetical protein